MATTINYNVGAVDKNSERFNMHAWVSRDHVRMASLNGSVTFAWIYQNRPNHYRYAIADLDAAITATSMLYDQE
jgi:hypothetical protein